MSMQPPPPRTFAYAPCVSHGQGCLRYTRFAEVVEHYEQQQTANIRAAMAQSPRSAPPPPPLGLPAKLTFLSAVSQTISTTGPGVLEIYWGLPSSGS
jgi:hypothetical protein